MSNQTQPKTEWPMWEVFVQLEFGEPHQHAGNVHAPDAKLALLNARDVYSRRGLVKNMWVVPSEAITASSPEESANFFEPGNDKLFRHPQFYKSPRGVKNLE